jgi:hypothetical protein
MEFKEFIEFLEYLRVNDLPQLSYYLEGVAKRSLDHVLEDCMEDYKLWLTAYRAEKGKL